jgi:hypothetical protein
MLAVFVTTQCRRQHLEMNGKHLLNLDLIMTREGPKQVADKLQTIRSNAKIQ